VLGVVAAARPVSSFTTEVARTGVDTSVRRAASALLTLSSSFALGLGASGLIGWARGLPALLRLTPSAPPLTPLATSGFAGAAAACWLLRSRSTDAPKPRSALLGRLLAAVAAGGTVFYAQGVFGAASSRGFVDLTSVLAFWFLGFALLGMDWTVSVRSRRYQPVHATVEDITDRKLTELEPARVHRAQQASSRCNQVLVRATDEATLLQQICDIIVEHTEYRLCWVGCAEDNEVKTVRSSRARASMTGT
jgi:hypothetical protein